MPVANGWMEKRMRTAKATGENVDGEKDGDSEDNMLTMTNSSTQTLELKANCFPAAKHERETNSVNAKTAKTTC